MQNESWMQPALQTSEAVLLPALERHAWVSPVLATVLFPPPPKATFFSLQSSHGKKGSRWH